MNSKRIKNYAKNSAIGIFIVLFMFLPLIQVKPHILPGITEGNTINSIHNPSSQGSYDLTTLPYFENISGVTDWVSSDIVDEATFPIGPSEPFYPMYFAETNRDGSSVVDNNHYLEDFNVMFDGLMQKTYPDLTNSELLGYYSRLGDYDFQDTNQENLYYSYMNPDFSDNSTHIETNGNFQVILSLIDWVIENEPNSAEASQIIVDQWNNLDTLLWDSLAYSKSNNDQEKYLTDQFIAAISGFLISQGDITAIEAEALSRANAIMQTITDYALIDTFKNDAFINSMNPAFETAVDELHYLSTNAYAIWSLIEWATNDPAAQVDEDLKNERIAMAKTVFQTLKERFWNDTLSLFITSTDVSLNPLDETVNLKDNALIQLACLKLFEATGNFSYFETAYQVYQAIETHLRDETNGNYYNSIDTTNDFVDENKNLGAHAYYFRTLSEFEEFAQKTTVNFEINETNVIYGTEKTLNITGIYNIEYDLGLTNEILGVNNSDAYLVIRYPNNTIFVEEQLKTNINGQVSYLFNTTSDLVPGDYQIGLRFNYTGLESKFYDSVFSIDSGIIIEKINLVENEIKAGALTELDIQLNSTHEANISITLNVTGEVIQNTSMQVEIEPNLLNNFTIDIQSLVGADFGLSILKIDLLNDSIIFETINQSITILSPVVLQQFSQDSVAYKDVQFSIDLLLESFSDLDTPISIEIDGVYINSVSHHSNIIARTTKNIALGVNLTDNAPIGIIYYNLEISRTTDGQIIYSRIISTTVERSIEILKITKPDKVTHGQDAKVFYEIFNHLPHSQNLTIEIWQGGELISKSTEILIENENTLVIDLGSISNPYSLGLKNYEILLKNSDDEVISHESINYEVNPSIWSFILGYMVPVIIPVVGIIVMKHLAMENKKRLG